MQLVVLPLAEPLELPASDEPELPDLPVPDEPELLDSVLPELAELPELPALRAELPALPLEDELLDPPALLW